MSALLPTYARSELSFARGEGAYLFTASGERYRIVDPVFAAWVRRQRPGSRAIPDAATTSSGQERPSGPHRRRKKS